MIVPIIGRFLLGLGAESLNVSNFKIMGTWFSKNELPHCLSICYASWRFGTLILYIFTPFVMFRFGIATIYFFGSWSTFLCILTSITLLFLEDYKQSKNSHSLPYHRVSGITPQQEHVTFSSSSSSSSRSSNKSEPHAMDSTGLNSNDLISTTDGNINTASNSKHLPKLYIDTSLPIADSSSYHSSSLSSSHQSLSGSSPYILAQAHSLYPINSNNIIIYYISIYVFCIISSIVPFLNYLFEYFYVKFYCGMELFTYEEGQIYPNGVSDIYSQLAR
jgi:MFS family permease